MAFEGQALQLNVKPRTPGEPGLPKRPVPKARVAPEGMEGDFTEACDPCTRLYTLPCIGPDRGPAFLKATAGRRGWYATVLHPGTIAQGAPATIVP